MNQAQKTPTQTFPVKSYENHGVIEFPEGDWTFHWQLSNPDLPNLEAKGYPVKNKKFQGKQVAYIIEEICGAPVKIRIEKSLINPRKATP